MTIRSGHEMVRVRTQHISKNWGMEPSSRALLGLPKGACLSPEGKCTSSTQCEAAELLGMTLNSCFVGEHKEYCRILHETVCGESKSSKIYYGPQISHEF